MVTRFSRDVTAVIPHIPVRSSKLMSALRSVVYQTQRVAAIVVEADVGRSGSAATRNRALSRVDTAWVAFLDDDDVWFPKHVDALLDHAEVSGADVIYPGCQVVDARGVEIPLREEWGRFGEPFSAEVLRERSYIPVTSLVRTELAQEALFGPPAGIDTNYDDWGFYLRLLQDGASFSHLPQVTWMWLHDGKNTSGRPDRW